MDPGIIKDDPEMIFKIKDLGSPVQSCLCRTIEKDNSGLYRFKTMCFVVNFATIVCGKVRHTVVFYLL